MHLRTKAVLAFGLVAAAYIGLSFVLFEMPQTAAAAEECGFLPGEFISAGELTFARNHAFVVSFVRKQEYLTAATLGVVAAFVLFAIHTRRPGTGAASLGIATGSGLIAVSALCVSCLAPVLSVVGLGVLGSLFVGVPKTLLLANAVLLCGWGTLYLTRKAQSCSLPPQATLRV